MQERYPMKLRGYTRAAIWGGVRLRREWGKRLPDISENVAESWELTVRERENSVVQNGKFAGRTLGEVLRAPTRWDMVTPDWDGGRFPLLVKLLDAGSDLSVQVHPDDAYASRVEHDTGKTEMWVILEAEPGARLVCGLKEGIRRADFCDAVAEGRVGEVLRYRTVRAGDICFIPAGMVHAIGGGILLAEIQENSDLTYRVYDYDRVDKDGNKRPLHTEKACEAVRAFSDDEVEAMRFSTARPCMEADGGTLLAACDFFTVRSRRLGGRHGADLAGSFDGFVAPGGFSYLLVTDGAITLTAPTDGAFAPVTLARGESAFLPAGMGAYRVDGCGAWLEVGV